MTAVSVWPISSCSSRATRSRSASCAASAVRAASRRALSSLSSMALKALARAAPSAAARIDPGQPSTRLSGSTELITSVSLKKGDKHASKQHEVQRQHHRKAGQQDRELPDAIGSLIVIGVTASRGPRRRAPRRWPGKPTTGGTSGRGASLQVETGEPLQVGSSPEHRTMISRWVVCTSTATSSGAWSLTVQQKRARPAWARRSPGPHQLSVPASHPKSDQSPTRR